MARDRHRNRGAFGRPQRLASTAPVVLEVGDGTRIRVANVEEKHKLVRGTIVLLVLDEVMRCEHGPEVMAQLASTELDADASKLEREIQFLAAAQLRERESENCEAVDATRTRTEVSAVQFERTTP